MDKNGQMGDLQKSFEYHQSTSLELATNGRCLMKLEFGLTTETFNTQYAPLAVLLAHYRQEQVLQPLENVLMKMKTRQFSPIDKLEQVLISILAGCETLSEVNTTIRPDAYLAQVGGWASIAEQSTLSETLDALTLMNIKQLDGAVRTIWRRHSATLKRDWRAFLWLDFDLSGLPSGKQAEESKKGYFSGKKTSMGVN